MVRALFQGLLVRRHLLALGLLVVGSVPLAYCVYDLVKPGHFVGDMYGFEVVVRLLFLVPRGMGLLAGTALACFLGSERHKVTFLVGSAITVVSIVALVRQASQVAESRRTDALRSTYPGLSVGELLRIARERDDSFAVDELGHRQDPIAVQGLGIILLDESLRPALRLCAAEGLEKSGSQEARVLLEEAKETVKNGTVRRGIVQALRSVKPRPAVPSSGPTT